MRSAAARRTTAGAFLAAVGLVVPAIAVPGPAPAGDQDLRANKLLRLELELADGREFYLLLDPLANRMQLMLHGTVLQDFPIAGAEIGTPRVAYVAGALPDDWAFQVWSAGELDPPRALDRFELAIPDGGTDEPPTIPLPPTPEERFPVPERFRIRFAEGLVLDIRLVGDGGPGWFDSLVASARAHLADAAVSAGWSDNELIRIKIALERDDAAKLYRSLPPGTKLLLRAAPTGP